MTLIPAHSGGGHKVAIGSVQVSGTSMQKFWFKDNNYSGYDYDFAPKYLFVYKMLPNTSSGSDGSLNDGTHMNIYDESRFSGFAYRAAIVGSVTGSSFYRTKVPASTGGNRIYDVGKDSDGGYFEFYGNTIGSATYCYVALE